MIKVREGSSPDFEDLQKQRSVEYIFGISQQDQTDFANITLASPEAIRSWSKGEVKNPETIKEIIDILKKEYETAVELQSKGSQYL